MRRLDALRRRSVQEVVACGVVGIVLAAAPAAAELIVDASVTAFGAGIFNWDILITNTGPEDFSLVSIVDAPPGEPLITQTLTAPAGFTASYDSGLGIVDFIESQNLFGAGMTNGGFMFSSVAAPGDGVLQRFEAFDTLGNFVTGAVNQRAVPEASTATLATVGLLVACWRRRVLRRGGSPA